MPITWKLTQDKPPDATHRGWREMKTACWRAVGDWWETTCKPRHFEDGAASRYQYRQRSPETIARKKRMAALFGGAGALDLVQSGRTRSAVMRLHVPRAFPSRVTIEMPTSPDPKTGIDYVQMRPKSPNRPNLGEELTTLSADEIAEAEAIWVKTFERLYTEYRETHVISG